MISAGACSKADNTPMLNLDTKSNCTINYSGNDYNCTLNFLGDGIESVTLNSPETLSGMCFRCSNGKYTVSLGSLICRSDTLLIPDNSFPAAVSLIMEELRENRENIKLSEDGNGYSYSSSSKIPYTLKTDKKGTITKIMLGSK